MAEWNAPLPDEAVEGDPTHVEDHNLIVAAIEEARQKVDDIEVPDTSNLATRVYVDNAIAGIDIPPPADLTGLATEAYVDSAVGGIEIPEPVDTSGFATKAELGDYQPAGDYATSAQVSGLAPKQYVDDAVGAIEMPEPVDTSSFATKSEVAAKADAADVEMKITGLNGITGLWAGTQAEYDAIPSRDPKVAYIIVEGEGNNPDPGPAVLAQDSFERTVADGWGTAPTGGAWTRRDGGTGAISVSGGKGVISLAPGAAITMTQPDPGQANAVSTVDYSIAAGSSTGPAYVGLVARRSGTLSYRCTAWHRADGGVWLIIERTDASPTTKFATLSTLGVDWVADELVHLKFEVSGTSQVSLRAKMWTGLQPEPAAWAADVVDDTPGALTASGLSGVYTYRSGSGTGDAPMSFDNFSVEQVSA